MPDLIAADILALGARINDINIFAYLAAFGGGVVSFLTPCVFPLVPVYLSIVTGLDLAELEDGAPGQRRRIAITTGMFVLGFGIVFITLGLVVSSLGRTLIQNQEVLTRISGTVMVAFALYLLGSLFLRAPWLYQDKRFHPDLGRFGTFAPVVAGAALAFGWSPCIGPVLGSILGIAATQDRALAGATLLAAYTLGMGLPFLAVGLGIGQLSGAMKWVKGHFSAIVASAAIVMLAFGVLLMFDGLSSVTRELQNRLNDTPFEFMVNLG